MLARLIAIIGFLCVGSAAQAFTLVAWGKAGSACVPSSPTVAKYDAFNAAAVRHRGTQVGDIVFTCHVERFDSPNQSWALQIAYRDGTGNNDTASVFGQLYRISLNGFTPALVGTVNSDDNAATGNFVLQAPFSHTFNFETNTYFVQITLRRSATTEIVRQFSAAIVVGSPD
jgi:hypothetical protein